MRCASHRKVFLPAVLGAAILSAAATAGATELTGLPARYEPANGFVFIGVYVLGSTDSVGSGNVVFTEGDRTLGIANGLPACDVPRVPACTVRLLVGVVGFGVLTFGPHTITAAYSGSNPEGGVVENAPASLTFTINVWNPHSLSPVLDLLSD